MYYKTSLYMLIRVKYRGVSCVLSCHGIIGFNHISGSVLNRLGCVEKAANANTQDIKTLVDEMEELIIHMDIQNNGYVFTLHPESKKRIEETSNSKEIASRTSVSLM